MKYLVEIRGNDGEWVDAGWEDGGVPERFETYDDAYLAIVGFVEAWNEDGDEEISVDDYRVQEDDSDEDDPGEVR